jgi:DNA-binding NarL/FixJ family response regulator/uncharacterized protein involved in exopolysaccharide biosynthesis
MLRILIVDDQKSIRETIKAVLEPEPDFEVVATANDGISAIELAKKFLPDLMLVDLEMPGLDGLRLTRIIDRDFPSIKVIVLSMHDQDDYIQESLQAGAMGYLLKNTSAEDLKEAIRFVSRGYTQFSPGLLHRVIPNLGSKSFVQTSTRKSTNFDGTSPTYGIEELELIKSTQNKQPRIRKSWKYYLPYWLAGNAILWGLAILYLIFKSPIYTSKWAISLPSSKNSSSLSLPDLGSVSSDSESPYHNSLFDPRENYKYLLDKKETLALAAKKVGMTRDEFGEPDVTIVDNTTMIELSIAGKSPQEAQQKAIAVQDILEQKLGELRQGHIFQSDRTLRVSLEKSEQDVIKTRQKLADFKAKEFIGAQDKEGNLSTNVEDLRRQRSELKAQLEQSRTQAQQLGINLGVSPQMARDAFLLQSDSLFQTHLSEYTRTSGELVSLESRFKPNNPIVIDKQEETAAALNALLQRGGALLGRSLSPQVLQQLNLSPGEEEDSYRGGLLKQLVSLQSESEGLIARIRELDRQLVQLESTENNLVQQRTNLIQLEQDVKFAETVYSSNLAKSKLAESNLYDAYPQIQVAIQPNLSDKPSSPNPSLVYLGTFMGSLFLTTAIASLWATSTEKPSTSADDDNNNHYKAIAPRANLNGLVKK